MEYVISNGIVREETDTTATEYGRAHRVSAIHEKVAFGLDRCFPTASIFQHIEIVGLVRASINYIVMASEILGSMRITAPFEITRTRAQHRCKRTEWAHDQCGRHFVTLSDCDVESLLDQINISVSEADLDDDLRISGEEGRQQRH